MVPDSTKARELPRGLTVADGRVFNSEGCEINVALHCNLACQACSHLSPVMAPALIDPDSLAEDLAALATAYRCGFVKLLGGEPLLHRDLATVIDVVRSSGISDWVLICTNGRLLDRIDDHVWSQVDEVEVSLYPGVSPTAEVLDRAVRRAAKHQVRLTTTTNTHFRQSYSEIGTNDADLAKRIFVTCKMAHVWRCHSIHAGHFFRCPPSVFVPMVVAAAGDLSDGVPLRPTEGLLERLLASLTSQEPLATCRHCLGSAGRRVEHRQIPRKEWRAHQSMPSEELLDEDQMERLMIDPHADDGCVAAVHVLVDAPK